MEFLTRSWRSSTRISRPESLNPADHDHRTIWRPFWVASSMTGRCPSRLPADGRATASRSGRNPSATKAFRFSDPCCGCELTPPQEVLLRELPPALAARPPPGRQSGPGVGGAAGGAPPFSKMPSCGRWRGGPTCRPCSAGSASTAGAGGISRESLSGMKRLTGSLICDYRGVALSTRVRRRASGRRRTYPADGGEGSGWYPGGQPARDLGSGCGQPAGTEIRLPDRAGGIRCRLCSRLSGPCDRSRNRRRWYGGRAGNGLHHGPASRALLILDIRTVLGAFALV